MFEFETYTDEQIGGMNLIPEGMYDFQVVKCEDKVSQSGNSMLKLQLKIWDNEGRERTVFDYLVSTANWAWKVKHFFESIDAMNIYEQKKVDESSIRDRCGKLNLIINEQKKGDYAGTKQNSVKDYLKSEHSLKTDTKNDPFNDDVPF